MTVTGSRYRFHTASRLVTMRPTQRVVTVAIAIAGCGESTNPRPGGLPSTGAVLLEEFADRQVFPASNWWNVDVASAPVDPQSDAIIDFISGRTTQNPTARRQVHPDFGPPPYGIPYVGIGQNQALVTVSFSPYASESDLGAPGRPFGYPIPDVARTRANYIEGGVAGGGRLPQLRRWLGPLTGR